MSDQIVTIEKDFFFKPNVDVHIHYSNDCKDFLGTLHRHKFIEVVYVLSGRATHYIGDKTYTVKKGDVSIINSNEVHAFVADSDCSEMFLTYDLMFTPNFLDMHALAGDDFSALSDSFLFYSLFPNEQDFKERFNLIPGCSYEIGSVFEQIHREYTEKKDGYVNLIRLYIAEILIRLLRKIQQQDHSSLSVSQKQLVLDVMRYIENNYSINLKNDDIAAKMFFNKDYLSKLFKKETGLSIHAFVKEIRMKEACKLLTSTSDAISDVAAACGFTDMKTFYALFKKHTGLTPKAYREQHIK